MEAPVWLQVMAVDRRWWASVAHQCAHSLLMSYLEMVSRRHRSLRAVHWLLGEGEQVMVTGVLIGLRARENAVERMPTAIVRVRGWSYSPLLISERTLASYQYVARQCILCSWLAITTCGGGIRAGCWIVDRTISESAYLFVTPSLTFFLINSYYNSYNSRPRPGVPDH